MMGGGKRCRRYEFGAICKANRPRRRRPVSCRDDPLGEIASQLAMAFLFDQPGTDFDRLAVIADRVRVPDEVAVDVATCCEASGQRVRQLTATFLLDQSGTDLDRLVEVLQ